MNLINKKLGIILYISFVILLVFYSLALGEDFLTIYNIKIASPDIKKEYLSLWNTIKGNLIYKINQINYYRIIDDEDISDIQLKFKMLNVKSELSFDIECQILEEKKVYNIRSKKDFEEFPGKFMNDLKSAFPLKGIIFKTNGLYLHANIGKYYNVKKGDIFVIIDKTNKDEIKGLAAVLNSFNRYSEMVITAQNQAVNNNDILLPFTFILHLKYHAFHKINYLSNIKKDYQFSGLYGPAYKIFSSLGNYMLVFDEKETGLFINENIHYEKIEDGNYNAIKDTKFDLKEKYSVYLLINGKMKLIKLLIPDKYVLYFDKSVSNYNLILEKDKNLYDIEDVNVNDFDF